MDKQPTIKQCIDLRFNIYKDNRKKYDHITFLELLTQSSSHDINYGNVFYRYDEENYNNGKEDGIQRGWSLSHFNIPGQLIYEYNSNSWCASYC